MSNVGRPGESGALRVAIVGAGPAGCYAAAELFAAGGEVEVELFDRLATPWGLVRAGVAPDHPKTKLVTRLFERTARNPALRFHGHVTVGGEVGHDELLAHHHAVLYAVGASADRPLGVPGEQLAGSLPGTAFAAWYNGHPDHAALDPDLACERAVVVGNGNVALDLARILLLGRDRLAATDVADHALQLLGASRVREVVVLGRRGPAQAAFTTPELRELAQLPEVDVVVDPAEVALDPHSRAWLQGGGAPPSAARNVELLRELARRPPGGHARRIVLRFLASPVELLGAGGRVRAVRVARNTLDAALRAHPTEAVETLDAGLVLRSIGHRGTAVAGVPFDEAAGTIPNVGGRVVEPATGAPLPGVYTAGWSKRGPSGVIATNRGCAQETVAALLEDRRAGRLAEPAAPAERLLALLRERQPQLVDYAGWELIDAHERAAGERSARPRVKLVERDRLVAVARGRG